MMNAGSTPGVLPLTSTAKYSLSTALMLVSRLGDLQPRSFPATQVAGPCPAAHNHRASRMHEHRIDNDKRLGHLNCSVDQESTASPEGCQHLRTMIVKSYAS